MYVLEAVDVGHLCREVTRGTSGWQAVEPAQEVVGCGSKEGEDAPSGGMEGAAGEGGPGRGEGAPVGSASVVPPPAGSPGLTPQARCYRPFGAPARAVRQPGGLGS